MARISKFDKNPRTAIADHNDNWYGSGQGGPPMDERLYKIEKRLDGMENRLDNVENDVREIKSEVKSLRLLILGTAITSLLTIIAVVIAFAQWQSSWFQHSLDQQASKTDALIARIEKDSDRNWQRTQETIDKIHAIELRMEQNASN